MNTKRVAATVIALALTAGCAIAQKADKDGQRKTQMEQIEKKYQIEKYHIIKLMVVRYTTYIA